MPNKIEKAIISLELANIEGQLSEEQKEILEKGKRAVIGEIREYFDGKYEKTATGWKYIKGSDPRMKGKVKKEEPKSAEVKEVPKVESTKDVPEKEEKKEELTPEVSNIVSNLFTNSKLSQSIFGGDNSKVGRSSKNAKELKGIIGEEKFDFLDSLYSFTKSQEETKKVRGKYKKDSEFKSFVDSLAKKIDEPVYRAQFNFKNEKFDEGGDIDMFDMSSFTKRDDFYETFFNNMLSSDELIFIKLDNAESGIDVDNFSDFKGQKEVIIPKGEKYKIDKVENKVFDHHLGERKVKILTISKKS